MNSVINVTERARRALPDILKAKAEGVPLEMWPGDSDFITIGMLPKVEVAPGRNNAPIKTYLLKCDATLQSILHAGKKYGVLESGVHGWLIGEWK